MAEISIRNKMIRIASLYETRAAAEDVCLMTPYLKRESVKNMNFEETNKALLDFLDRSPNAFYAVANMKAILEQNGFEALYEGCAWSLQAGKSYYVTRNDSALIAFRIPRKGFIG